MRRVRRFRRQTAQHNRVRACDYMAENDNLYDVLKDNMDENYKAFNVRVGAEAAATNILERAVVDTIIVPMGTQKTYPIF